MKKISLLSLFFITTAGVWVTSATHQSVYAVSGCCKQRSAITKPWYRSGNDLQVCKELNSKYDKDKDAVFNESGKVWWDLSC